jgi:hypothetical protein
MFSCRIPPAHLSNAFLSFKYRFSDPAIGPASAEISAHAFAHAFGIVTGLPFLDQSDRAHDLAWCTESALETIVADEGGLDGIERVAVGKAFDRQNFRAVIAERERQAGIDSPAIDEDRARAALAAIAAFLGSGQVETLAQQVEKRHTRIIKFDVSLLTVYGEADGEVHLMLQSVLLFQKSGCGSFGNGVRPLLNQKASARVNADGYSYTEASSVFQAWKDG